MALSLFNTYTKRKEEFTPLEDGVVRMYNCGPTVYSYAHIGNFASFLLADLLRRYLEYSGYEVLQVMNITVSQTGTLRRFAGSAGGVFPVGGVFLARGFFILGGYIFSGADTPRSLSPLEITFFTARTR